MQVHTKASGRHTSMIIYKRVAHVTIVSFPLCAECIRTVNIIVFSCETNPVNVFCFLNDLSMQHENFSKIPGVL